MKGLKIFRVTAATAIFIAALLSFLNFSMGWETNHILHIQFVPALLSLAAGTLGVALPLIILLLLTLIFGRVYCSFLCPTGILQDIIGRLARPFTRRTRTNPHSPGAGAHNTSAGSHSASATAGSSVIIMHTAISRLMVLALFFMCMFLLFVFGIYIYLYFFISEKSLS